MPAQKYDIKTELLEEFDLDSFFTQYRNVSANDFILKNKAKFLIDNYLLAEQLKLNNKLAYKIPTFHAANCWLTSKSFEQASGEKSALYKASLFSGKKLLDVCGGLGVDDWAFSSRFDSVVSIDIDSYLNVLVNHNFKCLNLDNVQRITADAYLFLQNTQEKYDLVYI
jgi:protein-L-isoaspartate O-methyltransferase